MRFPRRSSAGKSPRGTSRLHRLGRRVALGAASAALVVTGTFLLAAPPAPAAAPPQWRVRPLGQPTNFSASTEDSYLIVLTNVGTAPTVKSNNITITDSLPPGLTATRVKLSLTGVEDAGPTLCTTAPVQCVYPKGNLSLPQIKPGESLDMIVYVAVEPSLPAGTVLTDSVAVSGGGAPNASATTSSNRADPALGSLILRSAPSTLTGGARGGGDYSVVPPAQDPPGALPPFFPTPLGGVPADPSHNAERGQECQPVFGCNGGGLSSGETPR